MDDPIPQVTAVAGPGSVPVCGFPVLDQVVQDGVDAQDLGGVRSVVGAVGTMDDGEVVTFRVVGDQAAVMEWDREASYRVTRYELSTGKVVATTSFDLEWDGVSETFGTDQFEIDDAGNVYVLDTLMQRRDLLKIDAQGRTVWSTGLPEGPETTGDLLDLYGMVQWTDVEGEHVIGVQEAGKVLHRVSSDGDLLEPMDLEGGVRGQLPGGEVVVEARTREGKARSADLRVVDAQGAESVHLGATWEGGRPFGVGRAPWTDASGVTTGPGGEGLVVAEEGIGFAWYGDDGVFRGVWPDSRKDLAQPFAAWERTPVLRDGSSFLLLTYGDDGGLTLTEISEARMAYQLGAPVKLNAANEDFLLGLGLGAAILTDSPYNVFADGDVPEVHAVFDDAWGAWTDTYQLRYQVRGDPRVPDPVVEEARVVDLPAAGGRIPLELPSTRPGVYEVDAALVERASGEPVSGTCLRYTVASAGSSLHPALLSDGADWGGAGPLRGVELADQLGVGSHRVQLDFGAIVPDPSAAPDAEDLSWDSLPNDAFESDEGGQSGTEADPFSELVAAAALAERSDVLLLVQLGSGGEAERAAVDAGTWEGWAELIVAAIHERAPQVHHWEPWNEPNNTGFGDPIEYEEKVGAPFAAAARRADPDVVVVGGNTLGIVADWWDGLVSAGGCASLDVVGIHPYTGYNRTWEEEGFSRDGAELDQVRDAVAPCGDIPIWDTESGWWSDGAANFWAGGSDVTRKLLWYGLEGIDEWTYFFSEGGFGEEGNSWSLLQYGAYVKPSGAAFAATAPFLAGFGSPAALETGTPGVHAVGAEAEDGSSYLALWSDDLSTSVRLTSGTEDLVVEVRDQYGAQSDLTVDARGSDVAVDGAPVFLLLPPGTSVAVSPVEAFGEDVLKGRPVTATSAHEDAGDPDVVTSGTFAVRDPWRSGRLADGAVDESPALEVTTTGPQLVDRIAVATAGIRCCTSGLRDYTVSVRLADGTWQTVAEQTDQFFDRVALFRFEPVEITAVRVEVPMTTERGVPVLAANYTGIVGGLHPDFIRLATESDWIAAISAIQAFAPAS